MPNARFVVAAVVGCAIAFALPFSTPVSLTMVNGVLVAVALADGWRGVRPSAIEVQRMMPAAAALHGPVTVTWRVRNRSDKSVRLAIADELAPSLHAATRRIRVRIPPRATVVAETQLQPSRRGRFHPDEVVVRVDSPLRLVALQGSTHVPGVLRVLPPFRSRKEAELRIQNARLLEVGLRSAQGRGGGTEFDSLREYAIDDEMSRVDWSATARAGKLIVRTYRAERNQQLLVLLDCGRVMAGQVDGVPRLEWGMDVALTLAAVATRLGDRCGLLAFDRDVRRIVPPASGAGQMARFTEAIYDLDAQLVASDYRGAFTAALARFRRRALLVLVTDLTEEAVDDTLVPALPLVAGRHMVLVASIADPAVLEWATTAPVAPSEAYRGAAAARALEVRARSAARLRAAGATVVDGPPSRMPAAVADAYLRVKAEGRL